MILFVFNGDCRVVKEHHTFNKNLEELRKKNPDYGKEENKDDGENKEFNGSSFKRN